MDPQHLQEEFFKAYENFSDAMFRHCYLRTYHRERAKDIVQETFMRTWRYVVNGGKITHMRAFLFRSANNLIIEEGRKKKEASLDVMQEAGFQPSTHEYKRWERMIDGKEALSLLGALEEDYRDVIVMRFIDELTPKEIARVLNKSENVISVRIHRALKKLRALIA